MDLRSGVITGAARRLCLLFGLASAAIAQDQWCQRVQDPCLVITPEVVDKNNCAGGSANLSPRVTFTRPGTSAADLLIKECKFRVNNQEMTYTQNPPWIIKPGFDSSFTVTFEDFPSTTRALSLQVEVTLEDNTVLREEASANICTDDCRKGCMGGDWCQPALDPPCLVVTNEVTDLNSCRNPINLRPRVTLTRPGNSTGELAVRSCVYKVNAVEMDDQANAPPLVIPPGYNSSVTIEYGAVPADSRSVTMLAEVTLENGQVARDDDSATICTDDCRRGCGNFGPGGGGMPPGGPGSPTPPATPPPTLPPCPANETRGSDGQCHPFPPCPNGQVPGSDGQCYPVCTETQGPPCAPPPEGLCSDGRPPRGPDKKCPGENCPSCPCAESGARPPACGIYTGGNMGQNCGGPATPSGQGSPPTNTGCDPGGGNPGGGNPGGGNPGGGNPGGGNPGGGNPGGGS